MEWWMIVLSAWPIVWVLEAIFVGVVGLNYFSNDEATILFYLGMCGPLTLLILTLWLVLLIPYYIGVGIRWVWG